MRNIVLARVDDRLIHGEVVMGWLPATKATRIIIVDDTLASDPFGSRAIRALAPQELKCYIYSVEEATDKLMREGVKKEKILLLAKTPLTYERLIRAGVPLQEINLGGVGINSNRKKFFKNIALSKEEVLACEYMINSGCRVYFQLVPDQAVYEIDQAMRDAKSHFG